MFYQFHQLDHQLALPSEDVASCSIPHYSLVFSGNHHNTAHKPYRDSPSVNFIFEDLIISELQTKFAGSVRWPANLQISLNLKIVM